MTTMNAAPAPDPASAPAPASAPGPASAPAPASAPDSSPDPAVPDPAPASPPDAVSAAQAGASASAEARRAPVSDAPDPAALLRAYDEELRTEAETPSALRVELLGPLRLAEFAGGRGFITYRDLGGADATAIGRLVDAALAHFRDQTACTEVEWKTRGHDVGPGLHESLVARGFVPEETESIMIGPLTALLDAHAPAGVVIRRATEPDDVRAVCAAVDRAFGEDVDPVRAEEILARLEREADRADGMQLWAAEVDGVIVCGGRLEPVPGTRFVGIWGGATLPAYRGRGIYRALTAARAREALAMGRTLVHSDSTEDSRPILERSGLVKVSTTTPYVWRR